MRKKQAPILANCKDSLACQWWHHSWTMHPPQWRKCREGWGYGEEVTKGRMVGRLKILMKRGNMEKRQEEARWKHARLCTTASEPMRLWAQHGWANEVLTLAKTNPHTQLCSVCPLLLQDNINWAMQLQMSLKSKPLQCSFLVVQT